MSNKNRGSRPDREGEKQEDYYALISTSLHSYIDKRSPSQLKAATFFWGALALVLIAGASIPLPDGFQWVSAVIGSPAGVIVYLILAGLFYTVWSGTKLAKLRETYSHKKRTVMTSIGGLIFIIALVFLSSFIPYGVGGTITIIAALFLLYFLRKTPEERELDEIGLPDPRDDIDAYYEALDYYEEEDSDDDDEEDYYYEDEEPEGFVSEDDDINEKEGKQL